MDSQPKTSFKSILAYLVKLNSAIDFTLTGTDTKQTLLKF